MLVSGRVTYPTLGKPENNLQTCLGWGSLSSQEGIQLGDLALSQKPPQESQHSFFPTKILRSSKVWSALIMISTFGEKQFGKCSMHYGESSNPPLTYPSEIKVFFIRGLIFRETNGFS